MRIKVLLLVLLFLLSSVAPGMAAVVPDADTLPRDAGAPALPGGRHDLSKPRNEKSPSPDSASSSASIPGPGASKAPKPAGANGSSGGGGTSPTTDGHSTTEDKTKSGSILPSATDAPPASVMLLGVALLIFVVWAGWKSRQNDQDD